ncbi:hypothetical protein FH972_020290 [Carpinus fangiana]|uniref:Uncharacterized protein n=1 Tax=Carpinus fangiana TaxID=176857 RepID=A0A5N6RSU7_9ROSI|nr:hypothetical protein FH972_020290 [Carpinus fangiana]
MDHNHHHRLYAMEDGFQAHQIMDPQRPASSSMSSTVESFSGPRAAPRPTAPHPQNAAPGLSTRKRHPRPPPVVPEDCHSDCDSSSSVVDDDGDIASSSRRKSPLPFDLNFPPLDGVDLAGDDLQCTALCL